MSERLYLFDTTLRDGQQTQGVQFSAAEKRQIALALDALGIDYVEGGWPGANPTDSEFFAEAPPLRATMTAFGMTKRVGRSAEAKELSERAVNLAGLAHIRHTETRYDDLLSSGQDRFESREKVRSEVLSIQARWQKS